MKFETRFDLGDVVWYSERDEVVSDTIRSVQCAAGSESVAVVYWLGKRCIMESGVYATEAEAEAVRMEPERGE